MRILTCIIFLFISMTLTSQRNYYAEKHEQEAIKSAYRILKAFYPDKTLCVEDSIFDLDWWTSKKYNDEVNTKIRNYRLSKSYIYCEPIFEAGLSLLLNADSCASGNNSFIVIMLNFQSHTRV